MSDLYKKKYKWLMKMKKFHMSSNQRNVNENKRCYFLPIN